MIQSLSITRRSRSKRGVIKYTHHDPHVNPILLIGSNNKPNQK